MKCCKNCKHFQDAHYSRTYISPICTAHGGDDAGFFRQYVCGVDEARLYQPKLDKNSTPKQPGNPVTETGEGTEHGNKEEIAPPG